METEKLQLGELVRLKSGGPVMTISSEPSTNAFACVWFDDDGQYHSQNFYAVVLVRTSLESVPYR